MPLWPTSDLRRQGSVMLACICLDVKVTIITTPIYDLMVVGLFYYVGSFTMCRHTQTCHLSVVKLHCANKQKKADPDQMLHSVTSDLGLGLHCFPRSPLWNARKKWLKKSNFTNLFVEYLVVGLL